MKKQFLFLLLSLLGTVKTVSAREEIYVAMNDNTTATIYYDDQMESRGGEVLVGSNLSGRYNYVMTVIFDASVKNCRPGSLSLWFQGWRRLTTIKNLDYLNTAGVWTMQGMFHNCSSLESIDLSTFDTSDVTNMEGMFAYCSSLRSVNLSSFNTANVTDMSGMFAECTSLTSLDLSNFNTEKVTNMSSMFYNCKAMTKLDVSHFKTTALTNMRSMFENCTEIYELDLSEANTSKVTDMSHAFYECNTLNIIYADEIKWSTAAVTESTDMFKNCYNLCGSDNDYNNTCYRYDAVNDATYARVRTVHTSGFLTQKNGRSDGDPEPYAVLLADKTQLVFCYDANKESRGGFDIGPFTEADTRWGGYAGKIETVIFEEAFAGARPTSTAYWFNNCEMLCGVTGLKYLNTSEVTDMSYMFAGTRGLYEAKLDLSAFNVEKVTTMKGMFSGTNLWSLDVSKLNTENVTDMSYMFANCENTTSINLRGINTENVTDMSHMFSNGYVWSLDLSSFATNKVTNMEGMFEFCSRLESITVDEDSWTVDAVTNGSDMFTDCYSLKGGNGTRFSESHVDVAYARVDRDGQPGYLKAVAPSAYALLSDDNTVLTFYYDSKKEKRGGMGIGPFDYKTTPSWYNSRTSIKEVVFDSSFAQCKSLTSTARWFEECAVTTITGIENLNTDNVNNMSSMFYNCKELESLDLSHFNTSKVTHMNSMFEGCSALTRLDLDNFSTASVELMAYMFMDCTNLKTIYCDNTWNCKYPTTSTTMFSNCTSLKGAIAYDSDKTSIAYANPKDGYFTSIIMKTKCATPTISVQDGKLVFSCETEGVTFKSSISKPITGSSFALNDTYTLSVYATKEGLEDSEVATAEIQLEDKAGAADYKKGDVNGDGKVTITDAVNIVNIVLGGESSGDSSDDSSDGGSGGTGSIIEPVRPIDLY